jgi:hypothetical protein
MTRALLHESQGIATCARVQLDGVLLELVDQAGLRNAP